MRKKRIDIYNGQWRHSRDEIHQSYIILVILNDKSMAIGVIRQYRSKKTINKGSGWGHCLNLTRVAMTLTGQIVMYWFKHDVYRNYLHNVVTCRDQRQGLRVVGLAITVTHWSQPDTEDWKAGLVHETSLPQRSMPLI